jgi:hypothetical protein
MFWSSNWILIVSFRKKVFVTFRKAWTKAGRCRTRNSLPTRAESKARMLRAWRRVTLVALTAGAAIAAQMAGVAPAQAAGPVQAAGPAITIAAASKIGPVTGYVVVAYRQGKYASARIHGTITGATAGEVATLYAQSFPYTKAYAPVRSATLRAGGTTAYSFTVTPTLATHYKVKLFARKTAASPLATSPVKNVYVTIGGTQTTNGPCGAPTCRVISNMIFIVPSSALRVEMSKRLYTYFDVKFGPPHGPTPPLPEWLYLNSGHPSVTAARQISADKFEMTVTFSFAVGANSSESLAWLVCVKDTLSKDGLGLPGHHGCGASRVRRTVNYLG